MSASLRSPCPTCETRHQTTADLQVCATLRVVVAVGRLEEVVGRLVEAVERVQFPADAGRYPRPT